jgi:microcystin-dependent protein
MSNISQWSTVAGNNNAPSPNGAPEGLKLNQVNDVMREMMAAVARLFVDMRGGLVSGGTGNAYTLTTASGDAQSDQGVFAFRADRFNTGPVTLNRDGLGAIPLVRGDGTDLYVGDIRAGQVVIVAWNPQLAKYQYLNPPSHRVGTIEYFAGTVPADWIAITSNTQTASRTGEAVLFAAIGTQYGAGDGSTTFNLPPVAERVIAGKANAASLLTNAVSGIDGSALGSASNAQSVILTQPNLPAVNLSGTGTTNVTGGHTHTYDRPGANFGSGAGSQDTSASRSSANTGSAGDHSHTVSVTVPLGGSNAPFSTVQPTIILNAAIKR